jgi:transcriptional regulator GlxA family with amidase domain
MNIADAPQLRQSRISAEPVGSGRSVMIFGCVEVARASSVCYAAARKGEHFMSAAGPLGARPLRVSVVAIPDAVISTLSGIFDVMNAFRMIPVPGAAPGAPAPFDVEIVGASAGSLELASGVPVSVQRSVESIGKTDIVIVPSVLLSAGGWKQDRYPVLVRWLAEMHRGGAVLCSACSGIFLLAETRLFDGMEATVHYDYARAFAHNHPKVAIHPERVLVVSGRNEELVTSGAAMNWHDLVLYLIGRFVGASASQEVVRFFALQWHQDGLSPYLVFEGRTDHRDSAILAAQDWLSENFSVAAPVEEAVKRAGLAERTFTRRFANATGLTPITYIQRLRVEDAKRRLESSEVPVDEISWQVGYEDPAFFRRLFKRTTGLTPGAYRRRFQSPKYARATLQGA